MRVRVNLLPLSVSIAAVLALHAAAPALAAEADAADPTTLDRIVVTGEKRARTLQDTTSSVAVTTQARIEQENLQNLYEVLNRTANVAQTYGDSGFTIRGIREIDGGGDAPLATVYLDGAALPQNAISSAPLSLWDLQQVEILRGPQSTLQGENALAGAVILRTAEPTMDWEGKVRVLASDPSDRTLAAAFGGPIVADELAFRASVEQRSFEGYSWNDTRQASDDALHALTYRGKLLWTPSAIEGLKVQLGYTKAHRNGPYLYVYVPTDEADYFKRRVNHDNTPNRNATDSDIANLNVDYAIDAAWSLSAVTAWNKVDMDSIWDGDRSAAQIAYAQRLATTRTTSQEVRLNYDGQAVDGLFGLYWAKHDTQNDVVNRLDVNTPLATITRLLTGAGFPAANAAAISAAYGQALPVIPVLYVSDAPTVSENRALFADGQWHVGGGFSLIGGLRYDRQRYEMASSTTATFVGTYPSAASFARPGTALYQAITAINAGVAGIVDSASGEVPENTRDFSAFLPKLGARYEWSPDLAASLVVQRGYRSGGSSFNTARSQAFAYDPEYTWNYEASLRSQWLDGRLSVNANAYYIDWKDKQVFAFFGLNDYDYNTVNAGRAHLYGFELELSHRLGEGFDWYASLGYSRTRFDEFKTVADAEITDYAGREFAYAPRWTAAVGGNWRFGAGWVANLNANFRDKVYTDIGSDAPQLASRTLLNAKFGYENLDWSAWVFANNLLDKQYIQYRWADQPIAILGAPRVVGIGFEARW
jgi:outer membrane receptor protein involved in Fe transport